MTEQRRFLIGLWLLSALNASVVSCCPTDDIKQCYEVIFATEGTPISPQELLNHITHASIKFKDLDEEQREFYEPFHLAVIILKSAASDRCHEDSVRSVMVSLEKYRKGSINVYPFLTYHGNRLVRRCVMDVSAIDMTLRDTSDYQRFRYDLRGTAVPNRQVVRDKVLLNHYVEYLKTHTEEAFSRTSELQSWSSYEDQFLRKLADIAKDICPVHTWSEKRLVEAIEMFGTSRFSDHLYALLKPEDMKKLENVFICYDISELNDQDIFESMVFNYADLSILFTDAFDLKGPSGLEISMKMDYLHNLRLIYEKSRNRHNIPRSFERKFHLVYEYHIPLRPKSCLSSDIQRVRTSNKYASKIPNMKKYYKEILPRYVEVCSKYFEDALDDPLQVDGNVLIAIAKKIPYKWYQRYQIDRSKLEPVIDIMTRTPALHLSAVLFDGGGDSVMDRVCGEENIGTILSLQVAFESLLELSSKAKSHAKGLTAFFLLRKICPQEDNT